MKFNKVHCLFEQSGTFKNAFKNLGYDAEDYDILNDYGETDNQIDLYSQIEQAYDDEPSIFDKIDADDLIIAFFPCTRFENSCELYARTEMPQFKNISDLERIAINQKFQDELYQNITVLNKLVSICLQGGTGSSLRTQIQHINTL